MVTFPVTGSGGISISGGASNVLGPFFNDFDGINDSGVDLFYWWRVESKSLSRQARADLPLSIRPPMPLDDETEEGAVSYRVYVLAKHVNDLARKLKDEKSLIFPVFRVSRFEPFASPLSELTTAQQSQHVRLVDFTEDFLAAPEALEFTIDVDAELEAESGQDAAESNVSSSEDGIEIGGSATVNVVSWAASEYATSASGGMTLGGDSTDSSSYYETTGSGGAVVGGGSSVALASWYYSASGGMTISGAPEEDSSETFDPDAAIKIVSGTPISMVPGVVATCCENTSVSTLLALQHFDLDNAGSVSRFLARNGYRLTNSTRITYSESRKMWHGTRMLQGQSFLSNDSEIMRLVFEFGCSNSPFGPVDVGDGVWIFGMAVSFRNLRTNKLRNTRMLIQFSSNDVCIAGIPTSFNFSVNTETRQVTPAPVQAMVLHDGAGVFTGQFADVNPTFNFLVRNANRAQSSGEVYPELLSPMNLPPRGAKPSPVRSRVSAKIDKQQPDSIGPTPLVVPDGAVTSSTGPTPVTSLTKAQRRLPVVVIPRTS